MNLTLRWRGPVGPGSFPEAGDDLAALAVPGVYLRLKGYDGGRTVSYVGQSRQLIVRFDQHLRDILTFSAALRDETGKVVLGRDGVGRYNIYNALDRVMPLVAAEAQRLRFYWAACSDEFGEECLTLVEGALKARLEGRLADGASSLDVENRQGIAEPDIEENIVIENQFSDLEHDDRDTLADLLGTDPLCISIDISEIGFAG